MIRRERERERERDRERACTASGIASHDIVIIIFHSYSAAALQIRTAISPLLATNTLLNGGDGADLVDMLHK